MIFRLHGADHSTGKVLTFLDAHIECNNAWLEPLLTEIAKDRRIVVCPVIDTIQEGSFAYSFSLTPNVGGFNWQLFFRWCDPIYP